MVNIYELLNRIIVNKRYSLSPNLFIEADRTELSEEERSIFDLLKNIVSLGTKIHNDGIEFHPMFVMADGSRTFSIEDISEDDYLILHSLKLEKMPLILRALIADILWTNKKEFNAAKIAANAYWELFTFWYRDDDNVGTIDIIRRAVCISAQTKQTLLFEKIQGWFVDFLEKKAANNDGFFALRVMELFFGQKNFDVSIFLPVLDDLIDGNSDNIAKVEQAYKLKTECLFKLKRKEDEIKNNNLLADYYLEFAEKIFKKDIQGALRAVNFYQKGIMLYRNNGESDKADAAHKRLVEIQKEIPKIMVPFSVELDIKGVIDNLKANMEGLSFEECVIRLTQMFVFEKQEDIKKRVIEEFKDNPISHLFGKSLINAQGQTVLALHPLDIHDPEKDPKLMELHMYQNALEKQKVAGDIWVKNALIIIRDKFVIDKSMVEFLVKDNPIIPDGRERIFQSGLYMFLNGDYYEALHILAPQVENLFRNIAREVGGLTVTLEKDGSSMEKVLSSILSLPELVDCYDNDILFTFRGLLNEQAGANIRNEIAHGIISEYACSTGVCLYFGVAVIKLLSLTSASCYQILKNSEKLKHFEMPRKDALKVIH
jgi:tetratricopeptide (TPR) repeat protein